METSYCNNCLPFDLAFKIISFLQARDVCVLGSCSKYWRQLCASDFIWLTLTTQRWPSLNLKDNPQSQCLASSAYMQDWKSFYLKRHYEVATRTSAVVEYVEQCSPSGCLEARDYLKALGQVRYLRLDFKDVELILFKPKLNVLLNLVGLHYCIDHLQVPMNRIVNALECCKIAGRQVLVKWWKLGQWQHGFRQRDEYHYRLVTMADLATEKHEVLGVLIRGAVYEVMRIQVSVAYPRSEPWTCQTSA